MPHYYSKIYESAPLLHGVPEELRKCRWFRGKITEEQAEAELSVGRYNEFLVRYTNNTLILSARTAGWIHHDIINHGPHGYHLEGRDVHFRSISEMIEHYQEFPITERCNQVLGIPCGLSSGK